MLVLYCMDIMRLNHSTIETCVVFTVVLVIVFTVILMPFYCVFLILYWSLIFYKYIRFYPTVSERDILKLFNQLFPVSPSMVGIWIHVWIYAESMN